MLNEAAKAVGIRQKVLLKVVGNGDDIYPGQTGGFTLSQLDQQLEQIKALTNIEISGVTTFLQFYTVNQRKISLRHQMSGQLRKLKRF